MNSYYLSLPHIIEHSIFLDVFILLSYKASLRQQSSLHSLLSTQCPTPSSPLPLIYGSSISIWKRAGFPVITTKDYITSYNKTRHKPSYQVWIRQSSRRKRFPRAGKSQRKPTSLPLLGVPQIWDGSAVKGQAHTPLSKIMNLLYRWFHVN